MAAEKNFENRIKKYIRDIGGYEVKYFANAYTKRGIPDILACINGHFVGIEVKAEDGKPSQFQILNIKMIREAGGFAFVLYPSAWESFQHFLLNLKRDIFNKDNIPIEWR